MGSVTVLCCYETSLCVTTMQKSPAHPCGSRRKERAGSALLHASKLTCTATLAAPLCSSCRLFLCSRSGSLACNGEPNLLCFPSQCVKRQQQTPCFSFIKQAALTATAMPSSHSPQQQQAVRNTWADFWFKVFNTYFSREVA